MIKRITSFLLMLCLLLSLAACGGEKDAAADRNSQGTGTSDEEGFLTLEALLAYDAFGEAADTLMDTLSDAFWFLTKDEMKDSVNSTDSTALWGYAAYMEAAGLRMQLHPEDEAVKTEYLKALQGVENYRTTWRSDELQVYQCVTSDGRAECFYDDDVWVVLEFIHAYQLLGDTHWLTQAENTIQFCYSGWDEKLGGGVYWKEDDKASKNTCINAPLAVASAQLYQITQQETYLTWAQNLYDWTKATLLDTENYTFFDNINVSTGGVDRAKYSYNTGNMIYAAATLYQITGQIAYLEDARLYAEGAYDQFGETQTVDRCQEPLYIADSNSWFGGSLLHGYLKLYEVDASTDQKYIEGYLQTIAYACSIANDVRGYLISGWTESGITSNPSLLDQAGNARLEYLLQLWQNAH